MKVAILKTGAPPPALETRFGGYPDMVAAMLGEGFDCETFDVRTGAPPVPGAHAGVVLTGSPSGVYDGDAWITDLIDWLVQARGRTRMVGICFGHQVMAQAFGGQVEKSERGWGIGLHEHAVVAHRPWMAPPAGALRLPVSHQDQVVRLPPQAEIILASDFCPFAGLAYGEDAVSFQGHPEFTPAFTTALIEARRGSRYDDAFADAAVASLQGENDRDVASGWIRNFLVDPGGGGVGPS